MQEHTLNKAIELRKRIKCFTEIQDSIENVLEEIAYHTVNASETDQADFNYVKCEVDNVKNIIGHVVDKLIIEFDEL